MHKIFENKIYLYCSTRINAGIESLDFRNVPRKNNISMKDS